MANDVEVHNGAAGTGTSFTAETYDTSSGHRQIVSQGASGSKTFSDPAPTTTASSIIGANATRKVASIYNAGSQTVYLGNTSGVTTSNGFPLVPGANMVDDASIDAWWAITASGTGDLRIIEVT